MESRELLNEKLVTRMDIGLIISMTHQQSPSQLLGDCYKLPSKN